MPGEKSTFLKKITAKEKHLIELIRSIKETPKNAPLVIAVKDGEPIFVEKPVYEIVRLGGE